MAGPLALLLTCLFAAAAQGVSTASRPYPPPRCKAIPGTPDWPSPEQWSQLNEALSGRLIRPTPPGAVCHADQSAYNVWRCLATQLSWPDQFFHGADPVSVHWNNWAGDSCLPDPRLACSGRGYPIYVINATAPEHVQAGVRFAREKNVRLIVKNSGHDYLGRSNGPYALSIWVHHMKGIQVHQPGSFAPRGCLTPRIDGAAITAGAGTEMLEAYAATAPLGLTAVGGNGRTVALGGFVTGGGHSILSPRHGLAVDHVLEAEMVDPSGRLLTLNECTNEELFYAVRGGGGSTFGVLTSITIGTVPSPQMIGLRFSITTEAANPHVFDMVAYFLSRVPDLLEAGVSGYPVIHHKVSSLVGPGDTGRDSSGIVGNVAMLDTDRPSDILAPFEALFSHINSTWPGFSSTSNTTYYPSFYSWYLDNFDPTPAGHSLLAVSRLLDKEAITTNVTATKLAFQKLVEGGSAGAYMVSGEGVWNARPRGGRTAVNPRWREAYLHAATGIQFPSGSPEAASAASARAKTWAAALGQLGASGEGAYINEAHPDEDDWQRLFWGANYRDLLRTKRAVDPDDVFWCHPCVGSEGWGLVDGRLCKKQ
ncbi:hypothetical protein RB595_008650 [Gaeumannomyces hyphopodioides]